jgi:LuxR family maltose regulon positive regulatory protein
MTPEITQDRDCPQARRPEAHPDTVRKVVETRTSGVPAPATHELRRERLLIQLHKHRTQPLILLVSPAGFGKSTLAATYARDSGGDVAWLSLQPADRDARRMFSRLVDALDAAFGEPNSVPELRAGLAEGADGVGLAHLLLADLAQAPDGFIIVLDDFHLVDEAAEVAGAVDVLIRELPEAGQIVITAREPPRLSMTRLVVEGDVFALGTEDLRFSPDEIHALREHMRTGQRDDERDWQREAEEDERDKRAEGWIAGILLGGAPRLLNYGGGSLLGMYVEREVLSRLSPTEQNWLEMLSVFDTITPQAAERMLGPANWRAHLLALTERCAFLVGGEDGSYRLHALVHETVLNHLRRSVDERPNLAWTVAREMADEAGDPVGVVRACQELGQVEGAAEVVLREASRHVRTGRWQAVLLTLELLPELVRTANPDLSLMEARALLNTGRPQYAQKAAEAALEYGGRTGLVDVQIRALIELSLVAVSSDLAAAEDWLSAAEHLLRHNQFDLEVRRLLEGRVLGLRGILATEKGDIKAARDAFETGERLLSLLGPSRELALIQQNFGSFCNRTGDFARAQAALDGAASHWRLIGDRNGLATTQTILGDLHLRLGSLDAAGAALYEAVTAARQVGAQRMQAFATVAVGQWHRASGRLDDAILEFDNGIALADEVGERELMVEVLVFRAEVAILCRDLQHARKLLARAQAEAQRLGANATSALVDRALGRLYLVDGADGRAVSHLQAALERAGDAWGPDQRAETLYWLGTAHLHLGWAQQATAFLERAIGVVEDNEMPTSLAGPAAEDDMLLQHGRAVGLNPVLLAEIERWSATRRPWTGVAAAPAAVVVHNDLPRIEVQLFGSFLLHRDGQLVTNGARKVDRIRSLAAILILNPQGMSDTDIVEAMFPEMERERALHNLQMSATGLRKLLGSKPAVRFSAHVYQLSPQLELIADVREFDAALNRARSTTGEARVQALSKAVDLYRGPLLADAAFEWLETVRLVYLTHYVEAALQLADHLASIDTARSDTLAENVITVAPDTEAAYERLMNNARLRSDQSAVRRIRRRYHQAAERLGFMEMTALEH